MLHDVPPPPATARAWAWTVWPHLMSGSKMQAFSPDDRPRRCRDSRTGQQLSGRSAMPPGARARCTTAGSALRSPPARL
ncbi:hypothetical protein FR742_38560 [Nonomuraea sp. C10]|nr:hypothetical protein FR742_38560 [Nonomuraea sp. C10]